MVRICLLVRFMVVYRVMSPSTIVLYVLLAAMLVVRWCRWGNLHRSTDFSSSELHSGLNTTGYEIYHLDIA